MDKRADQGKVYFRFESLKRTALTFDDFRSHLIEFPLEPSYFSTILKALPVKNHVLCYVNNYGKIR
jgi:hypothetical protein